MREYLWRHIRRGATNHEDGFHDLHCQTEVRQLQRDVTVFISLNLLHPETHSPLTKNSLQWSMIQESKLKAISFLWDMVVLMVY